MYTTALIGAAVFLFCYPLAKVFEELYDESVKREQPDNAALTICGVFTAFWLLGVLAAGIGLTTKAVVFINQGA